MWFFGDWFQAGLWFDEDWFNGSEADGGTSSATTGSTLYPDLDVWLVKFTLTPKAGGSTVSYSFTRDYYPANALYSGSPETYPLLAADPQVKRSIGIYAANRQDTTIQLFGKSDMTAKGVSFKDLLQTYELQHSDVAIYYYPKPSGGPTTHSDTDNLRGKLKGTAQSYDEASGVLSITARDVWFKDKEISRKLESAMFPNLDPKWDGEYGPIAFGQSTTAGQGVVIDAPFVDSTASTGANATSRIFAGWGFTGVSTHSTKAIDRFLARNQHVDQITDQWVQIDFPVAAYDGETVTSPVADPPNWPRDLSRYSRGVVYSPGTNDGRILTLFSTRLQKNATDRCVDIIDGQHLYNAANPDFLSYGNKDMTVGIWVNFDTRSDGSAIRIICAQGDAASGTLEWAFYFPVGDNHVNFGVSSDGVNITTSAAWGTNATTGVWFFLIGQHDSVNHAVGIQVNAGTAVTTTTTGTKTIANAGTPGVSRSAKEVVTGTTTVAHGMHVGDAITISGVTDTAFNTSGTSTKEVLSVPSSTTWTHEDSGGAGTSGSGTLVWVNAPHRRNGPFRIGSNVVSYPGFDGKAYLFQYWSRLITGGDVTNLYNSGTPVSTKDISDAIAKDLRISCEMNEPYGIRRDNKGNADLTEGSNSTSLSSALGHDYISDKALTFDNAKTQVYISIYLVNDTPDAGLSYTPRGNALRKMPIDLDSQVTTSITSILIAIDPPLVLNPLGKYLITVEASNISTNSYFLRCSYDSNSGSSHYALDRRRDDQNWYIQGDVRFDWILFYAQDVGFSTTTTLDGGLTYSYYDFERPEHDAAPNFTKTLNNDLDLKLGVQGIQDDMSATYTAVAHAVIENPSDLIRFCLMNADFGLGLTSTEVDTSTLSAVRTSLSSLGITHKIVINQQTYAEDFIIDVCRQARIIFYKTRQGKLALKYPMTSHEAINYSFSEANHRGDMALDFVKDNDYSQVVNFCRQYYAPDTLNLSTDPAVIRRAEQEKLQGKLEITSSTVTSGDSLRLANAVASEALYGRRELTEPLNYFDNANTGPIKVQNYYFDRYNKLQQRFQIRIPMRDWFTTIDLFSNIRAQHTGIADANGTSIEGSAHGTGTALTVYQEGIPTVVWNGGQIEGQVLEVTEEGPWLAITCETTAIF
jgi:hypothetical protein